MHTFHFVLFFIFLLVEQLHKLSLKTFKIDKNDLSLLTFHSYLNNKNK